MTNKEYHARLDRLHTAIARAFADAVYARAQRASVTEVLEGVMADDVEAIARAVGLTQADMTELLEAVRGGYVSAGVTEAVLVKHVFDVRNQSAERWLATKSSELVVMATQDQVTAIRSALSAGMEAGRNPRSVALDIVGRINKATKRREGGIIGLYPQQVSFVNNARAQLEALDPEYLTRKARDRRFDVLVRAAIRDDKPIPQAKIDVIIAQYSDNLLKVRGDTIAATEALSAISSGEEEARQQALSDGVIDLDFATKMWSDSHDGRTRDSHYDMHGQERRLDEPFITPDGYELMHPGDNSLGAPAKETIRCRCRAVTKIDYIGMQKAREAKRNG